MDIIIQLLGFTAGDGLEDFIRERLSKLDKDIKIVRVNVTLFTGSTANPNRCYCEMKLEMPGDDIFVKKSNDTFDKAIVDTVNTIQRNLHKAHERQLDRDHGK
jgi:putative sigma-54 modulation protein